MIFEKAGAAVPYWNDLSGNGHSEPKTSSNEEWVNPDSFQIIAPGGDGMYGVDPTLPSPGLGLTFVGARMYPTGVSERPQQTNPTYQSEDDDSITNFCNKARLGDAKP